MNIILFLLCVTCAVATSGTMFSFDNIVYPKWLCYYFITAILAVLCTAKTLTCSKQCKSNATLHTPTVVLLAIVTLTLMLFKDYDALANVAAFIFLLLYLSIKSHDECLCIEAAIIIAGMANSIAGLYQLAHGASQITGMYDSHVGFSLSIVFATIIIANYGFCKSKSMHARISCSVCILFFAFIIVKSESRIGVMSLALSLLPIVIKKKTILVPAIIVLLGVTLIFKSESTKGRYFIYKTTLSMFDSPQSIIVGRGKDGFRKSYMLYQAQELDSESEKVKLRADNIKHPLNEFLLLSVNYGVLFAILCATAIALAWLKLRNIPLYGNLLLVIIVYSLFAYPFKYPVTWIILAWSMSHVKVWPQKEFNSNSLFLVFIYVAVSSVLFHCLIRSMNLHSRWTDAQNLCYIGLTGKAMCIYESISKRYPTDIFQYNYASFLNKHGMSGKAKVEISKCKITDYDTQMLRGDISAANRQSQQALHYYMQASRMCPNRFAPLYSMLCIYDMTENKKMRNIVAYKILKKKVKIESAEINVIKRKAKESLLQSPSCRRKKNNTNYSH